MKNSIMRGALSVTLVTVLLSGCSTPTGTTSDVTESATNSVSKISQSSSDDSKKTAFINDRFEAIRFEAAKGGGENIDALAALLGEPDRQDFARWMKTNYAPLFADLRQPTELLTRIREHRG